MSVCVCVHACAHAYVCVFGEELIAQTLDSKSCSQRNTLTFTNPSATRLQILGSFTQFTVGQSSDQVMGCVIDVGGQ